MDERNTDSTEVLSDRQPVRAAAVPPAVGPLAFTLGIVFLAVCAAMSLLLVVEHLAGLSLPGCGPGSPCSQAAESIWGKIPYLDWPVSFVGLAYFAALLVAWLVMRRGVPSAVRWLVRLGVVLSVGFTIIMFHGRYVCPYCLVTHISNFLFWILMETTARRPRPAGPSLAVIGAVFALCSAALGVAEWHWRTAARELAAVQAQESETALLATATQPTTSQSSGTAGTAATVVTEDEAEVATASGPASRPTSRPGGFTGRYHLGPLAAPLRIVIFMDYECKGCHLVELELQRLFALHPDIYISVKQWPGNRACNHYANPAHENACRAARAAEAAGLLGGNDAFWKMHFWLFEHNGRFTEDELRAAVQQFGFDPPEFERVMNGDEVLRRIQADVEEGYDLGLESTPLIYVNGFEFKGWSVPLTLTKVVEEALKHNLPLRTAAADHPPPASGHFISEWRDSRERELPTGGHTQSTGPAKSGLKVVVWGDFQQANTALVDQIIRGFIAERGSGQYTFRYYPLNPECNPAAKDVRYPLGCRAACAAEAAARLGGNDGYWKMHDWLLKHQKDFSDDTLRASVTEMGLDATAFFAALDDPAVAAAVSSDAEVAQKEGLRSIPFIFINGKLVPRWRLGQQPLLRPILEAAATKP